MNPRYLPFAVGLFIGAVLIAAAFSVPDSDHHAATQTVHLVPRPSTPAPCLAALRDADTALRILTHNERVAHRQSRLALAGDRRRAVDLYGDWAAPASMVRWRADAAACRGAG